MNKKAITEFIDKAKYCIAIWIICLLYLVLPSLLVMWFLSANDLTIVSTK